YDAIDPTILDAVFYDLATSYGEESWFDLFSLFAPVGDDWYCEVSNRDEQATLVVAAYSAATGVDLRSRFATEYGFPIDNGAWPALHTCAEQRLAERAFDLDALCRAAGELFRDGFEGGGLEQWSECSP
ncbi:MAG TPA: hypothetical protein VI942_04955, partial [Thermoanaerobaculia bacterium]|nr:hypothetical protein [Thermoanaerobaculia bacterium]